VRAALALLLVCGTAHADAAGSGEEISFEVVSKAPVGAWGDYRIEKEGGYDALTMRYALAERSAKKLVIETSADTKAGSFDTKLEYSPAGKDAWKLDRARVKVGDNPEQAIPPGQPTFVKRNDPARKFVGKEPITTPAGTFACRHYRRGAYDIWLSDKVQPIGLVKKSGLGVIETLQKVGARASK
jgi:hypothetical protein